MKKGFWFCIGFLVLLPSAFAAKVTMQLVTQPIGTAYSQPISFGLLSLAPVPQQLCGPILSSGTESATCSGLPLCKGKTARSASFSCSITTSCNGIVPANSNCTTSLTVTKPNTMAASTPFAFTLSYGSYDAVLTSNSFTMNGTNPPPPANGYRTITFTNSCNIPIWFGTVTGAAPSTTILTGGAIDCTGGNPGKLACVAANGACYGRVGAPDACYSQYCTSDSNCMNGASCHSSTNKCFWNNPTPSNGSFQLTTGASNTIQIPEYDSNGIGVVWSGVFGGRTGCTSSACTSALCTIGSENAQGVCSFGAGFQQPATQSEPTFITYPTNSTPTPTDAYDVTVINGANIPMSMYPSNSILPVAGNPYTCGAPGYNQPVPQAQPASETIGASSWQFNTNQSNVAYRYVVPQSASPTRCSIDTDCASGQYCGLTYSAQSIGSTTAPGSGYLVCGLFAGWFTADQICGTNNNFTNALDKTGAVVNNFQCNTPIALGTMSNLYQCNGNYAVSCYSSASANCCGCVNWGAEGTIVGVPTNPAYVANCVGANTSWTGSFSSVNQPQVYDTILYLKQSCPSCYTYPFDDKSSSFTCSNGGVGTKNSQDYTIEFCPGGNGNTDFQPPAH
jgi:hypothetical protein